MAFSKISAGRLNAQVYIEAPYPIEDGKGQETNCWRNIFGEGRTVAARWVRKMTRLDTTVDNTKDDRVFASETATVTLRYTSAVNSLCRLKRRGETRWWYIIGSPDRSDNGNWVEMTVERRAASL